MKFTGKARDAETGLDYFLARYYSGAQGRFTSPDPMGIMKQKLLDPQQWNMYAYARNNPLRFLDPTGMYVCNGTKFQCAALEAAREADIKSKDQRVRRAANAFGTPSKKPGDAGDNGVNVTITRERETKFGEVSAQAGTAGFTVASGRVQQATDVQINANSDLQQAVAHEGTHVADRADYVATVDPETWRGDPKLDITHYQSEVNAFTAQNAVIQEQIQAQRLAQTGATFGGKVKQLIDIPSTLANPPYSTEPYLYDPLFPQR